MEQTIYKLEIYVLNFKDRENIIAKMEALGNTCFNQSTVNYLNFSNFNNIFTKYINQEEVLESTCEGRVFLKDENEQVIKMYIHDFDLQNEKGE